MEFNNIYSGLISGKEKLALVGLGYVGMPIAVEFAKHVKVIGFDINEKRVNEYKTALIPPMKSGRPSATQQWILQPIQPG